MYSGLGFLCSCSCIGITIQLIAKRTGNETKERNLQNFNFAEVSTFNKKSYYRKKASKKKYKHKYFLLGQTSGGES